MAVVLILPPSFKTASTAFVCVWPGGGSSSSCPVNSAPMTLPLVQELGDELAARVPQRLRAEESPCRVF